MLSRRKKQFFWHVASLVIILSIFFVLPNALAQDFGTDYLTGTDLPTTDVRIVVVNIIRIVLGVIGIIFLLLVIWAGWLWMTAGGNDQLVVKAQKIMVNAVIGLIIIFLAFAITTFVFNILQDAGNGGGPGSCIEGDIQECSRCIGGTWVYDLSLCPLPGSSFRIKDFDTANENGDDAEDVYLCSSVQAHVNNQIEQTTVPGNVSLKLNSVEVPITISSVSRSIEMIPDSLLDPGETYTAHYAKALSDTSGLALSQCNPFSCFDTGTEFVWSFITGNLVDSDAPAITLTYPISDLGDPRYPDRNVTRSPLIRIKFSENVRASTIDDGNGNPIASNIIINELDGQGGTVISTIDPASFSVITKNKGFDLTLIPPSLFDSFTWYRITVQNIEDLCGNKMTEPLIWEFETNDKAPGVGGWYPKGDTICPDAGVITLTFNTNMYTDMVGITVSEQTVENVLFDAAIRASQLDPGPYQTSIPEGTWSVDPLSNFRVFTFALADSLQTNTPYFISITTDRVIDVDGTLLTHQWNFTVSDAVSCSCAPYISSINPQQGLLGECVTIKGWCFQGAVPSDPSDPRYAFVSAIVFDGVPATIGATAPNFVTTSVPNSFSNGSVIFPDVTITYNDAALGSLSSNNSSVDFFVASDQQSQGPCLLNITPNQACHGQPVRLDGLRFGSDPGPNNRSTPLNNVSFADGAVFTPDSGVTSWSDSRIKASVPLGANDGGVMVTANGLLSNSIPFDLACGVGTSCSKNLNTCDPDQTLCALGLSCNNTTCVCESITVPSAPRVISKFPTCSESCINVSLGAKFNQAINSSTLNDSSIDVLPCSDDSCTLFGSEISYQDISYDTALDQVNITPLDNLTESTAYRVILSDTITSSDGINLGGLNYDSDGVNGLDSYTWTFKTKVDQCVVTDVLVSPVSATADTFGQTITYNAYAYGSTLQCGSLQVNRWKQDWTWHSSDLGIASITSLDVNTDSLVDPKQKATALKGGQTVITASTNDNLASGILDVIACDFNTDCTLSGLCPGSYCDDGLTVPNPNPTNTCAPVVTSLSPSIGPVSRWISVNGCYFESKQRSGSVIFDTIPAVYPACTGGIWSHNQIVVEVPSIDVSTHPVFVNTHRGLTSINSQLFDVINECVPSVPIPTSGVPGICRIIPTSGQVNRSVRIDGNRFGTVGTNDPDNAVTYQGPLSRLDSFIDANGWNDTLIQTTVPLQTVTGDVLVSVNFCPSNAVTYSVTTGIDTPCDGGTQPLCQVQDALCGNGSGLYCDPNLCTCQIAPTPTISSAIPSGIDICRNAMVEVVFDQLMDKSSLVSHVILEDQAENKIPTTIRIFDRDINNDGFLKNLEDSTIVQLLPPILEPNKVYTIQVDASTKSRYGVELASTFIQTFTTQNEICAIDHVDMTVVTGSGINTLTVIQKSDIFFCAERNDCPKDVSTGVGGTAGNQHKWIAQAYDNSTVSLPLSNASYIWEEKNDIDEIFELTDMPDQQEKLITPKARSGDAEFSIGAYDPFDAMGSATTTMQVSALLCDNPWPALPNFPYKDSATDFSLYYCRDLGNRRVCSDGTSYGDTCTTTDNCLTNETCIADPRDDLTDLIVNSQAGALNSSIIKEFFFLPADFPNDVIVMQVYENPDFLNPAVWYNTNTPNPGSPQSSEVDGYAAVRDGRTTYVGAAYNVGGDTYAAYIYLLTYNANADAQTENIYRQLLDNWKFTISISDLETAANMRNDTVRITDLGALQELLDNYFNLEGNYPLLSIGSFIQGKTTSRWIFGNNASWYNQLGAALGLGAQIPLDPINMFSSCPDNYDDQESCWDSVGRTFTCADGSHIYQYEVGGSGSTYTLYANMEVDNIIWEGFGSSGSSDSCTSFSLTP